MPQSAFEKVIVVQMLGTFLEFCDTGMFIVMFTRVLQSLT